MSYKSGPFRRASGIENTHKLPDYRFPPTPDMEAGVMDFIRRESSTRDSSHLYGLLPLLQRVENSCTAAGPNYSELGDNANELAAFALRAIAGIENR